MCVPEAQGARRGFRKHHVCKHCPRCRFPSDEPARGPPILCRGAYPQPNAYPQRPRPPTAESTEGHAIHQECNAQKAMQIINDVPHKDRRFVNSAFINNVIYRWRPSRPPLRDFGWDFTPNNSAQSHWVRTRARWVADIT